MTFRLLLIALMAVWCGQLQAADPLRVFIRGGKKSHGPGAHEHERFLGDWTKLLTERGMVVSGGMQFPDADQLSKVDVLILYAQEGGEIPVDKRPGLEAFLKRGGGIVVIHTASVPLNNPGSSAYLKSVIGGSWVWGQTKWLEGPMSLYYVDRTHPISQGTANFDVNDEIYYDLDMDPSVRVLAAAYTPNVTNRRGPAPRGKVTVYDIQPQMWTYERTLDGGKPYRAFVSIPGHMFTTFELPHYRAVLLRGIAWAGQRANVDEYCTPAELASLRYPAGGPSRPEDGIKQLAVHPEFTVKLVASEPLVNKVMNIDWDPAGRLWAAETPEYPDGRWANSPSDLVQRWVDGKYDSATRRYDRPAYDKISRLSDTNGDGIMDKKEIFYEGLELVTSFVFFEDGVIASQAPDILRLRDTDGDGRADKVEKLYTGLGTGDTHAVINNLRWGFDGWIYATHGYSGGRVKSGDGSRDFGNIGSGVVRFKPDGNAFEQFSSKGGNTWGLQIAWDNEVFWTQPTSGDLLMHVVMSEDRIARSGAARLPSYRVVSKSIPTFPAIAWDQIPYVQIDQVGRFTAAAGAVIYDGGAWPAKWNYGYFTTEPTINIVHHQEVQKDGVSYAARRETGRETAEFIGGKDKWFRPIEVRTGPDGAVYVVDFYNQAVVHNDTRGPKHGPRNAAIRPDRDHFYSRILRIDHRDARPVSVPNLLTASPAQLVQALESPNDAVRMTALRLIAERRPAEAMAPLRAIAAGDGFPQARVAALWALARVGGADAATINTAAEARDPAVRKNAARVAAAAPAPAGGSTTATALKLARDPDPRVRLEGLNALASSTVDRATASALVSLYASLDDSWSKAAFMSVAGQAPGLLLDAALAGGGADTSALVSQLTTLLAQRGSADDAGQLVVSLAGRPAGLDAAKAAMLSSLQANTKLGVPAMTPELRQALQTLLRNGNPRVAAAALPLAVRWDRDQVLAGDIQQQVGVLSRQLADAATGDAARAEVAATLLNVREGRPEILPAVAGLLAAGNSPALQLKVVDALGALTDPAAGAALVKALPGLDGEPRTAAVNHLFKRPAWSQALLDALDNGSLDSALLGPATLHRFRLHPDAAVSARAVTVIEKLRGPEAKEKAAIIARLTPEVEKSGNVTKGRDLFAVNCAVCHQFNGAGNRVGPPLDGMGAHGAAELLVHIIDPNREVDPSFVAWTLETKDGEAHDGVIVRENNAVVALRNAAGEQEIRKDTVKSRRNTGRSLMPEGLEALGAEGLRDILTYMGGTDNRFRFVDLAPAFTADSRRGMYRSLEATTERLHIGKRGVVTALGVPFRIADPARHPQGFDVMVLKGGAGAGVFSRKLPQKVEARLGVAARQLHFLGGVAGWGYPAVRDQIPAMKVTAVYADGTSEEFVTRNGVEFADYNQIVNVPGSKLAAGITEGDQARVFTRRLKGSGVVAKLVFESFDNDVAATTLAVTADLSDTVPAGLVGAAGTTQTASAAPAGVADAPAATPMTWGPGTRVLLVGGGSSHDFQRFFNLADVALLKAAGYSVNYTEDPAVTARELPGVDAVVLSVNKNGWDSPAVREAVMAHAAKGKGIVLLHAGVWLNYPRWPEYNRQIVGGVSRAHDRIREFEVKTVRADHPVMAGVSPSFKITDELYHFTADPQGAGIEVLAETSTSEVTKKNHPSVWVVKHPQARIAGIALGHDGRAHSLPEFQGLLRNAVKWAAGR